MMMYKATSDKNLPCLRNDNMKLHMLYLASLLIIHASDTESNPGQYPCQVCA